MAIPDEAKKKTEKTLERKHNLRTWENVPVSIESINTIYFNIQMKTTFLYFLIFKSLSYY